jgi:hypothetical protein
MKTKSPLNRKMQLVFESAILTLLFVGAIFYSGMVMSGESDRWVRHTHEVLENLEDLPSAIQSVESSYREFVLTGKGPYLESYRASILRSEQEETIVRNLTVDIIIVSARDGHANSERPVKAGAEAFQQKPVDNAELLTVIWQVLGEPARLAKPAVHDLGTL